MTSPLHTLIASSPVCKPIKADLRASTVTLEWPTNLLVRRSPYVVVALDEAEQAMAESEHVTLFNPPVGQPRVKRLFDDLDFSVRVGDSEWTCYLNRIPEGNYPKPPGTWWGNVEHTDSDGRTWSRSLDRMVTNDFGSLVSCATGGNP